MKKITVLSLVLVAVLAIGSVGFAADLLENGLHPLNTTNTDRNGYLDSHDLTIGVTGEVAPYASIYLVTAPGELFWDGSKGASSKVDGQFRLESNTPISLTMGFEPLTHIEYPEYKIATTVKIFQGAWNNGWTFPSPAVLSGIAKDVSISRTNTNIQDVADFDYRLAIKGDLGTIPAQAAGDYSTEILLTIAAANL